MAETLTRAIVHLLEVADHPLRMTEIAQITRAPMRDAEMALAGLVDEGKVASQGDKRRNEFRLARRR